MKAAARDVLPPEWIGDQVERMIDDAAPYMTGEQDSFRLEVPLQERVDTAFQVVEELAEEKLRVLLASSRPCTPEEGLRIISEGFSPSTPLCIPPGFPVEQVALGLIPHLTAGAQQNIRQSLPNTFTFSDRNLCSSLQGEQEKLLHDILDVTRNGFSYSDADLRADLNEEQQRLLDDTLDSTRNGFQYTEADLRSDLTNRSTSSALDDLDEVRETLSQGYIFTDTDLRGELSDDEEQTLDKVRDYIGLAQRLRFLLSLRGSHCAGYSHRTPRWPSVEEQNGLGRCLPRLCLPHSRYCLWARL